MRTISDYISKRGYTSKQLEQTVETYFYNFRRDTREISKLLVIPEFEIEKALHRARKKKSSVKSAA